VVPISAQTALQAVRDAGRVEPGQHVLVIGASGGVGTYAVQLAQAFGATVVGVSGPTKLDLVRSLGVDQVLDHTRDDLGAGGRRYDVVLDLAGNRPVRELRRLLTSSGTLVFVGGEGGGRWFGGMGRPVLAALRSVFLKHRLVMLSAKETVADLETLAGLAAQGAFRPVVDRSFTLAESGKAIAHLEAGHARGKVVVVP
jgi:NADPH:quinone reductase-like Zn-dependent oxidoreductase